MITFYKEKNKWSTFSDLVMAAFGLNDRRQIKIDPIMQCPDQGCGTIEIDGIAWDWFNRQDRFEFMRAE